MGAIFIIGIYISLFQFILLLNKKSKSLSDKILTFWMLVICVHLISYYLHLQGYWLEYPHLVGLTAPVLLLYGPLLFLYVSYSLKSENRVRTKDYWHFGPVIIAYLYMMPFFLFYSAEEKRLVDSGEIQTFDTFSNILLISFIVSGFTYSIYTFFLLKRHQALIEENFSYSDKISLNWLRGFIWCIGLVFISGSLVLITRDVIGISYPFNPEFIFYSILIFSILLLGYFGIRHQNIFVDNAAIVEKEKATSTYKKSGLRDDVATEKYNELLDLMSNQKPYLEPKLSLSKLAEILEVSPNHLSQIVNQFEGQNFNDFVNMYRVHEFIEQASTNGHLSYLSLALASGFNSKSTFNAVFKKQKGVSPSAFMANHTS